MVSEIAAILADNMLDGWEVSAIIRHRNVVGSDLPYRWTVRAQNEDEDEAGGEGDMIEDALRECCRAISDGLIKRRDWQKDFTGEPKSNLTLESLGLSKPKVIDYNFPRPK